MITVWKTISISDRFSFCFERHFLSPFLLIRFYPFQIYWNRKFFEFFTLSATFSRLINFLLSTLCPLILNLSSLFHTPHQLCLPKWPVWWSPHIVTDVYILTNSGTETFNTAGCCTLLKHTIQSKLIDVV